MTSTTLLVSAGVLLLGPWGRGEAEGLLLDLLEPLGDPAVFFLDRSCLLSPEADLLLLFSLSGEIGLLRFRGRVDDEVGLYLTLVGVPGLLGSLFSSL